MFLVALSLLATMPAGQDPCTPFAGGPTEGMCPGPILWKSGDMMLIGVVPGPGKGPPLDPDIARTIDGLLAGRAFPKALLAEGATVRFCTQFSSECDVARPFAAWPLNADYAHDAPYRLHDGRIRIAWLKQGKVEYLSYVTMAGSKAKDIWTAPAQIPVKQSQ